MQKITLKRKTLNTTKACFYIGVDDVDVVTCNVVNAIRMAEIELENGDDHAKALLPPPSANFSTGSFVDDPLAVSATLLAYLRGMYSEWLTATSGMTFFEGMRAILNTSWDPTSEIYKFLDLLFQSINHIPEFATDMLVSIDDVAIETDYISIEITTAPKSHSWLEVSYF